jgi:hypothetical protein
MWHNLVSMPTEWLAGSVVQNECPPMAALIAISAVTHLPGHDNIRVLPHNEMKSAGNGQAKFRLYVYLMNSVNFVFYWVFDGN